jgi:hypothetical protein
MLGVRTILMALSLGVAPMPVIADTSPAKPAAPAARADMTQIICRREQVTGSLVRSRKICMTRADWAARSRNARETGELLQQQGRVTSCGSTEPGGC